MRKQKLRKFAKRHVAFHKHQLFKIKKHPFFFPIVLFFILFFLTAAIFINFNGQTTGASDSHVVLLNIEGQQQTLPTRAPNVGDFLTRVNLELSPGDVVEPALDTEIYDDDFKVNVYRARPVTVIDGNKKVKILTAVKSHREAAQNAGITVYPEDEVETSVNSDILKEGTIGEIITINRAIPVNLNVYGTNTTVRTQAKFVKDLLVEKNLTLNADDTVTPNSETPITPNMQIIVIRNGIHVVNEEKIIPAPLETIEDSSLSMGTTAVRQQGADGKKLITYQIEIQGGQEISRKIIQEVITQNPVKRIIARGPLGSFGDALARLRKCESGGNYANKSNPRYRGAYQYDYATWNGFGGFYDPADAPPPMQDQKATETYQRRGWQPWPACSAKLGLQDIYR